jgi:hypothetical protein
MLTRNPDSSWSCSQCQYTAVRKAHVQERTPFANKVKIIIFYQRARVADPVHVPDPAVLYRLGLGVDPVFPEY